MSNYSDLDGEERLTLEQRVKASTEQVDALLHFTPEEKVRWEKGLMRDRVLDIQLETERLEAAEKAIKTAAYQKAKARRKAKREALEAGMTPEGLAYHKKLEEALRILPKTPPRELIEGDFLKLKAAWLVILGRFSWLEAVNPAPVREKGATIVTEYTVTEEED